ncbi:hypothetical protein HF576_18875 [Microbacterium sp. CFH 90308]|uniref:Prepilin-type N-terminal cleavage/methylation domain-containing protein n=1 Tax=Microbacterium salsuginis TaxID=2722803 RepID=A0ABX1KIC9_9MICO|nr:hypothetical protein [Microbacterium sp. CFH 90308]NLP85899.1 hypothetical protein [Microbacterium sp. CFH 90308]
MTDRSATESDAGITLVELIIYVLVSSTLLLATAMILINSVNAQRDVLSMSEATARGQAMGATIERALRNAVAVDVATDPTGATLRVHTSLAGALECQGFVFSGGDARTALSDSALSAPSGWTVWESGILPSGAEAFFTPDDAGVAYAFEIATDAAPVRIAGETATRINVSAGVTAPCW